MSMTTCRECGVSVSSEAEKCPGCGVDNPSKEKHIFSIIFKIIGTVVVLVIAFAILTYSPDSKSQASCEITDRTLIADVFVIDGQPDAGYLHRAKVRNNGKTGEVEVKAKLSTSEGEFNRSQKANIKAGEDFDFSFAFHEPSVNAQNVQYTTSCRP